MSATHAVKVPGIGWAAFSIYWVVTTLTSKRIRLANAAKRSEDDQLGAVVCLIALINLYNLLNGITHQPQVTTSAVGADKGVGIPMVPKSCPTQSACTAGRVRSK